jgi:hypothetical protein
MDEQTISNARDLAGHSSEFSEVRLNIPQLRSAGDREGTPATSETPLRGMALLPLGCGLTARGGQAARVS